MNLTNEQIKASSHKNGPALVLAVPGSGKTTMLLRRTLLLIESGVKPDKILIITFSRMAAKDMQKRFYSFYNNSSIKPYFATIHSFCFSIIKNYERKTGLQFQLLEGSKGLSKYKILKDIYKQKNNFLPNEEQLESLIREISFIKNKMYNPSTFANSHHCKTQNLLSIFQTYEEIKKQNRWIDFDDMITLSLEILKEDPILLKNIRKAYDYIQVDEGQDTSFGQMQIIQSIAKPNNNLFIVADDDQSIYGFRGADYQGLFELKKIYPDLKEYYLSINFRSSQSILSTCKFFIEQNTLRFKKEMKTNFMEGPKPKILRLNDLKSQYDYILKEMENKDLGEVAILYRNNICSLGLVETLEENNISFRSNDTRNNFLYHWVTSDLLDILSFSQDTSRIDLYEKFYYKINGYVSKKNIDFIKKRANGQSVFDIMLKDSLPPYLKKNLRDLKNDFSHLKNLSLKNAFRFIEFDLNYRSYITKHAKTFGSSEQSSLRILYYLKYIARSQKDMESFIGRLKHLDHLLKGGRLTDSPLLLSTLHGSKGLEFDTVFIIDLIEDIIPSPSSIKNSEEEKKEELEEERRLFYVGMSRAKKNLYLLSPKTVNHYPTKPSVFFEQIQNKNK